MNENIKNAERDESEEVDKSEIYITLSWYKVFKSYAYSVFITAEQLVVLLIIW